MKHEHKRTAVAWGLVLFTLWPLVHFGLVRALDLNPWKWFGLAMYTVPRDRYDAHAFSLPGRERIGLAGLEPARAQRLLESYAAFVRRRDQLRGAARPDAFARALFDARPELETIEITVQRIGLERESAMVVEEARSEPYVYRRQPQ